MSEVLYWKQQSSANQNVEETHMSACMGCNGDGKCKRCDGTGVIEGFVMNEKCEKCHGRGNCTVCHGSGKGD